MQKHFLEPHPELPVSTAVRQYELAAVPLTLVLRATPVALVECQMVAQPPLCQSCIAELPGVLECALAELEDYFAGRREEFSVPLSPAGTEFQRRVWLAARQIPYGQTRSYQWVAVHAGNPQAMRAVGNALGANPLMLFIPCHRVLRHDGGLGGFRPGAHWKQLLLAHEQRHQHEPAPAQGARGFG